MKIYNYEIFFSASNSLKLTFCRYLPVLDI